MASSTLTTVVGHNHDHIELTNRSESGFLANSDTINDDSQQPEPEISTHPLFSPLPVYGSPSIRRQAYSLFFRITSSILSLAFLGSIVICSLVTSIPGFVHKILCKITFRNHRSSRPFYDEEVRRSVARKQGERAWRRRLSASSLGGDQEGTAQRFKPTEGGRDPIVCDIRYYARRVGLEVEHTKVVTEDGFLIELSHVFDPEAFTMQNEDISSVDKGRKFKYKLKDSKSKRKFPVLLMHGLLQSSGAFCCNDDFSLAFWLCKAGYDVWLGNNRCGFHPEHETLKYGDPRMWCWNIQQMGVYDLSALVDRVLLETEFAKIGLVCHSQGTTQTFVALAKDQRPSLGKKISVFCALAPAAYAGNLIGQAYFRFIRMLSPFFFRLVFGIHAFIPFMLSMHQIVPPRLYGWLGYKVFSFLFSWSDSQWDRGLRNRLFQFAPVYVSAEAMRWWLGVDGFARHTCILATAETVRAEDQLDAQSEEPQSQTQQHLELQRVYGKGATAWYGEDTPPMAMWVCGDDELVDGRRLLRRLENGREPAVRLVHSKVIDGYEHLDVLWAMDAVDQVFVEVKEVLWKTCHVQSECIVPEGCEGIERWEASSNVSC